MYTSQELKDYWAAFCPRCGWHGLSSEAAGGTQIADTGDYTDAICPCCHDAGYHIPLEDDDDAVELDLERLRGHSSGPWFIGVSGPESIQILAFQVRSDMNPAFVVATVNRCMGSESDINALLIASAPALLRHIRDLELQIDNLKSEIVSLKEKEDL